MKNLPISFKNLPGINYRLPAVFKLQNRQLAMRKMQENPRTSLIILGIIIILIGVTIHENSYGPTGEWVGAFGTCVVVVGVIYKDARHFFRR